MGVADMEEGSISSVQSPENTRIPTSILQKLKETKCVLEIDVGTYTCTIDGRELTEIPSNLESVDIGMTAKKDEKLSALCGGTAYELRFNYHGELPGLFTFRVEAKGSSPGDTIFIYYFDEEAGAFEGQQEAVVDSEGYVSVGITHCSSYYMTSDMIAGAKNSFTPADATTPEAQIGLAAFIEDNFTAFWTFVCALVCIAVITPIVLILHRRAKRKAEEGKQTQIIP